MTDELPAWDFDPVPEAGRDRRIREFLLGWCCDDCAPALYLVQDTVTRDDVAELVMGFAKVYRDDMFGAVGRDLTIARLAEDLEQLERQAAEEAQQ